MTFNDIELDLDPETVQLIVDMVISRCDNTETVTNLYKTLSDEGVDLKTLVGELVLTDIVTSACMAQIRAENETK